MTTQLAPTPIFKAFDNFGLPLSFGKLYTYQAGTTTPQATYTDSTGNTPNPNPITLNARGETPLWLNPTLNYKFLLTDALGNQIPGWPVDNINGSLYPGNSIIPNTSNAFTLGSPQFSWANGYFGPNCVPVFDAGSGAIGYWPRTAAEIAASVTPVNYAYPPGWAPRYGVTGNGTTDDTTGMKNLLACSINAVVPFGFTPLISSTLTIPAHAKLEFQGGFGNGNGLLPGSYLKMASSMTTTNAVTLLSGSQMYGGGVLGSSANTGGGIVIAGNGASLDRPFVQGTGGDGIRVGNSGGANCNSFRITKPVCVSNTGKGISIHDGNGLQNANCNAGQIDSPFTTLNGSHGLYLGHCWWVTVINPCSESNTGYGVYCDGTNDTGGVPICRFPTITGGDANEGNTAGQWFDQSYFGIFINPDGLNVPSTAVGALAGSGWRTVISARETATWGMTVNTNSGNYLATINDGTNGGMSYPLQLSKVTTASNGDGIGMAAILNPSGGGAVQAGSIRWQQVTTAKYDWIIAGYNSGPVDMLVGNTNVSAIYPATDNSLSCGFSSNRWTTVYATTGTINTSDEREKEDIAPIHEKVLDAWSEVEFVQFRWKGKSEFQFGVIAQRIIAAFERHGLNAHEYGLIDLSGDLYGVRYEQCLCLEAALLRRERMS